MAFLDNKNKISANQPPKKPNDETFPHKILTI